MNSPQTRTTDLSQTASFTDGILLLDTDWRVLTLNEEFRRQLGCEKADPVGKLFWDICHAELISRLEPQLRKAVRDNCAIQFEMEDAGNGRRYWIKGEPTSRQDLLVLCRDITGHAGNADTSGHRKRDFDLLFEQSVDAILIAAADGTCIDVNPAGCDMLGYRHDELLGMTLAGLVVTEDEPEVVALLAGLAGDSQIQVEWRLCRKDGSSLVGEVRLSRFADGRIQTILRDISQHKQAEQAIARLTSQSQSQRRLYETILSHTPDLVYVFDLDHRFIYANKALLEMWGRSWNEAIGKTCLELGYEPWHAAMHDREIEQVIATRQPIRGEVPFSGAHGRRIYDYIFAPVIGANGEVEAIAGTTRDVTDRKQQEEALRDSRERLQAALNGSGAGTFRWNIKNDALEWDENLDRLFGLPPGVTIRSLENFIATVHPDDRAGVIGRCQNCASQGADFDMEFRVIWPDGSIRWLDDKGKTFFDADGKPHYMAGMCIDITERKRAQQLETSQKKVLELITRDAPLVEIYESIIEMIEGQSDSGTIASILLLDEDGLHLRHGAAPNLPEAYNQAIDGIAIGPTVGSCGTAAYHRKAVYVSDIATDPLWKDFADLALSYNLRACWSTPIFSSTGRLLGTFALYHDEVCEAHPEDLRLVEIATRTISIAIERKQAEAALRESDERFRTLADNIPQLAWIAEAGTEGHVTWYNRNWFDYTGTTLEEMQGTGWHKVHHPEHAERVIRKFAHHVKTAQDWEDIFPLRGKDGKYRWFLSRMKVIRDATGTIVRLFGTNTDITEQREMEDELRRLATELAEVDRRKDEFLALLAHELRNPLAPIRNAAQILHLSPNDSDKVQVASHMIERQVSHLVRLVDDLLDVNRISRGKIDLVRENVDLASIAQLAIEATRAQCQSKQHSLSVDMPDAPVRLIADPVRLAQIIGNLLNNACKFTPKGGRVRLVVQAQDGEAVIRVQDNGIGIPADRIDSIFDMFVQLDTSLERTGSGLGIGLTLVRKLVEMHHGTVEVYSEGTGGGSEFVVRLPISIAMSTQESVTPPADPAQTKSQRILVVDDNRDSATSLAALLQMTGNETLTAFDGYEALNAAETHRPDVVLLDIGLPKLNGYDVARRIRQEDWGRNVLLVALTGWGKDEDRQRSNQAGFDGHLVKPVDLASLQKLLTTLNSPQQLH